MQLEILLIILIPSLILSWIASKIKRKKSVQRQLQAEWGTKKTIRILDEDAMEGIAACYRDMPLPPARYAPVDAITWSDLDMDAVFRRLNHTQSGVGEEVLYAILHRIDVADETLQQRDRWMHAASQDADLRMRLQRQLRYLGHEHDHGAFAFLQNPQAAQPAHAWVYYMLAIIPFGILGLGFINPLWLLGLGISLLINALVYYRTKKVWMRELAAIRHLAGVLQCARRLRRNPLQGMEDGFERLQTLCTVLRPLARWSSLLYMQRVTDYDFITDYLRLAFQLDMISLIRLSAFTKKHAQDVQQLYFLVGEIDACIGLASVRKALPHYTTPEFTPDIHVQAKGVCHPLLTDSVPNSMDWNQNVLITGSNASGKSTFVKAMALNAVLAQTLYTCWAERFALPRAQVFSSMALRDNVQGGESYFIVEIKSLHRILQALQPSVPTLCFIDEILRGTNTVERIAASRALLLYLNDQNVLCIAATHDMELTALLPAYRQVHFREEITPQGMVFPYQVFDGVSHTRNAIRLLEQMGFPQEIIQAADALAEQTKPGFSVPSAPDI